MGEQWTKDFKVSEFADNYTGENKTNPIVCQRMQQIYDYLDSTERGVSSVEITSGYRSDSTCDKIRGAFIGDGHNKGIAADFIAFDKSGLQYTSDILAAVAEHVGFGGIAIIDGTAVHVDIRDVVPYYDKYGNRLTYWRGDERTGNDNMGAFTHLPQVEKPAEDIIISLGGRKYKITEV